MKVHSITPIQVIRGHISLELDETDCQHILSDLKPSIDIGRLRGRTLAFVRKLNEFLFNANQKEEQEKPDEVLNVAGAGEEYF